MTREEKAVIIDELTQVLKDNNIFYLTDTQGLNAKQTSDFRRACFKKNIEVKVVKNTLLKKAMDNVEEKDYEELYDVLVGKTTIMISEVGNAPAKLIKDFRKKSDKPILKGAYVEEAIYVGDDKLDTLSSIKSKEEVISEIVGLLQSPIKTVISQLKSGGDKIAGVVKTLSEKEEK